jgi:hypothetical protein
VTASEYPLGCTAACSLGSADTDGTPTDTRVRASSDGRVETLSVGSVGPSRPSIDTSGERSGGESDESAGGGVGRDHSSVGDVVKRGGRPDAGGGVGSWDCTGSNTTGLGCWERTIERRAVAAGSDGFARIGGHPSAFKTVLVRPERGSDGSPGRGPSDLPCPEEEVL